jgi:RNA polymerase-binding transcription factor DksA
MDQTQARALLAGERARLQRNAEQTGMAVEQFLRARWAALVRAEVRLAAGSYGRSVHSGQPIPDQRLEADPLAELTVEEAAATERGTVEEGDDAVGLVSANHPFEVLAQPDITPEEEQASEEDDEPAPEPILGIHIEPHNQAR